MTQLVLWSIMAYGLSNIVVYSKIFAGVRNFFSEMAETEVPIIQPVGKFLQGMTSCMMCFGFHCGWFLSLLVYSPTHELLGLTQYASWFFDGILSSGAVWAINSIIEWFEQNRPVYERRLTIKEEENNKQIL
jgi:hypothetical protein